MPAYIVIAAIAILVSAYFYHRTQPALDSKRRLLLFVLRSITLAIVLLFLISPVLSYIRSRVEKPQVILLTDISRSMDLISGTASKTSTLQSLSAIAAAKFTAAGYESFAYNFANGLDGERDASLLAPALHGLAEKHDFSRVKAIVLASDGWLRDENLDIVKRLGAPFYVLADTSRTARIDLAVTSVRNNRHAYRNEPTLIRAEYNSVNHTGPAVIKLVQNGRSISSQNLQLQSGASGSVDFNVKFPNIGFFPFSVEIEAPGVNERGLANNRYPGAVEVLAEKQQIVVISENPAWDNKFIMDSITENNRWNASHFHLRGGAVYQGDRMVNGINVPAPAAVIVVNNGALPADPVFINYLRSAHAKGAGILWQGLPLAEVGDILPLRRSNITGAYQGMLNLLPAASGYPMFAIDPAAAREIPPLDYYYVTAAPNAEVLGAMDNPQSSPAIAVSSGKRVICMAFLNLWKWQLQSKGASYKKIFSSTLTWLANPQGSGYRAIHENSYFRGEEIIIRLRAEDDIRQTRLDLNPRLRVFDKDNKEVFADFLTRGDEDYGVSITGLPAGDYSFRISENGDAAATSGRFSVAETSIEDRDFDYNLSMLNWLASDSRGKLLTHKSLADFSPLPAQSREIRERHEIPLYRKWYLLLLFILSFCVELFFRRRWGLL